MVLNNPTMLPILSAAKPFLDSKNSETGSSSITEYIVPVVAAIVISNIATAAIDEIVFSKKREEELAEKMYRSMEEKISSSSLPRREDLLPKDAAEVENLIDESIKYFNKAKESLESAKNVSRCGVCKNTIDRVREVIERDAGDIANETRFLKSANKKIATIRKLKKQGKIPEEKRWEEFTKDEKELVRRFSNAQ